MIQTLEISPGIRLSCYQDTRFKQGCLSLQLIRPMDADECALNALLSAVLLRGTRQHPDLRSITGRLDELYGAAISPLVRRVGDYQTLGMYCAFVEDRFAMEGDAVLAPLMDFLRELLLDSPLEDGGFLSAFVEGEKRNLISTIESERNDKRVYAMAQLLKLMCRKDRFGLSRLGEPDQVAAITPQSLYEHYRKVLRTSQIYLFYVGSASAQEIAELVKPLFARLDRHPQPLAPQTPLRDLTGDHAVETMEVTQGKLCMGFSTPITNRDPEFPAMQVLNTLYGAGMTSKLFMNIREKLSLCYSIGSSYYGTKGILLVAAGIDFDREEQTRQEVLRQLEECRRGNITGEELAAAKEALLSSLRAIHDSPGAIEGYYATAALSGMGMTPAVYMDAVEQVTLEQVVAAANTLQLHSTYFLKGECQ